MPIMYHFTGKTLRDGRPVPPIGEWLIHEGKVEMCASGLHASKDALDALQYAPGALLHKVELKGEVVTTGDKSVGRKRKIIATIDATDLLRRFARTVALDVVHLWNPPQVVLDYLTTGDERLRDAAWDAAWAAARAAAWAAALAAVWAAAWAAAWDAAWDAARAAARDVAWDVAWDAARDAARDAAWDKYRAMFKEMVHAEFDKQGAPNATLR